MQSNLLFNDTYYYLILLSHIESLKKKAEYQVLAEDIPQDCLKEIINMRNRVFIGLIRCGLNYEYVQDAEDPEKDKLRFTIDNINYDCVLKSIKNVLKKDFSHLIKEAALYEKRLKEKNKDAKKTEYESIQNEINNENTANNNSHLPLKSTENKQISEKETKKEVTNKKDIDCSAYNNNKKNNISKEEKKADNKQNEKNEEKYETTKNINTFLYDITTVEIFQPGATIGDKMTLTIMPLRIEKNNVRPDIAVSISSLRNNIISDTQVFVSQETSVIQLEYKGYQLLVRGTFKNGIFTSYVIASGATAAIGCGINSDTIKIRGKENINYGHICFKKNNAIIHALPLNKKNENDGFAHFVACIEENNHFKIVQNIDSNAIRIDLMNGEHFNLKAYFVDDYFSVMEV